MSDSANTILALLLFAIYMLPSMIAHNEKRDNEKRIFMVNLLLGWTVIGWFIALAWAMSAPPARVKCPMCAEQIQPDAKVCPHCRNPLPVKQ